MNMKKEFIEALDKITDKLINLDKDKFIKLMLEHKEGKYASILKDAGFFYQQDCYYEFKTKPITDNDDYEIPENCDDWIIKKTDLISLYEVLKVISEQKVKLKKSLKNARIYQFGNLKVQNKLIADINSLKKLQQKLIERFKNDEHDKRD